MKITLKKKSAQADRAPLVIMVEDPRDFDREPKEKKFSKIIRSVNIGETIDVSSLCPGASDEDVSALGHKILSRYKGCFSMSDGVSDKSVKRYSDKSLAAEAGV